MKQPGARQTLLSGRHVALGSGHIGVLTAVNSLGKS